MENHTEEQAIENFLMDIDCLEKLKPWIDKQNIFDILKLSTQEIRHSNFLAWLFNPNESHSFGDRIIKDVICKLIRENRAFCKEIGFESIKMMLLDYSSFSIYREKEHIDLLMISDVEQIIFCFENKVFSGEHGNQLKEYMTKINKMYPQYKVMYIFLTPDGIEASDEQWLTLSYRELIKIIEVNKDKAKLTTQEQVYVENYINTVRRSIMQDEELMKICSDIYFKHKQALDLIYANKPNASDLLFKTLIEKIKKESKSNGIELDLEKTSKTYIRFNTNLLLQVLPPFEDDRVSNWGTKYNVYYEVINEKDNWRLQLAFSRKNLSDEEVEIRRKVFEMIENGRKMGEFREWKSITICKNILPKNINVSEMTYDEIINSSDEVVKNTFERIVKEINEIESKINQKSY